MSWVCFIGSRQQSALVGSAWQVLGVGGGGGGGGLKQNCACLCFCTTHVVCFVCKELLPWENLDSKLINIGC